MSVAYKCDRCGGYSDEDHTHGVGLPGKFAQLGLDRNLDWAFWRDDYELWFCINCTDSLVEAVEAWFNAGVHNETK